MRSRSVGATRSTRVFVINARRVCRIRRLRWIWTWRIWRLINICSFLCFSFGISRLWQNPLHVYLRHRRHCIHSSISASTPPPLAPLYPHYRKLSIASPPRILLHPLLLPSTLDCGELRWLEKRWDGKPIGLTFAIDAQRPNSPDTLRRARPCIRLLGYCHTPESEHSTLCLRVLHRAACPSRIVCKHVMDGMGAGSPNLDSYTTYCKPFGLELDKRLLFCGIR